MKQPSEHRRLIDSSTTLTELEHCVRPLLKSMQWTGTERQIKEALPHFRHIYTIAGFCEVMTHLKFEMERIRVDLDAIDPRFLPCLFISDGGTALVLLSEDDTLIQVFDSESKEKTQLSKAGLTEEIKKGVAYTFHQEGAVAKRLKKRTSWVYQIFQKNKSLIYQSLWMSMILSLLALASPLYTMFVYDKVVAAQSIPMLSEFASGIGIVYIGVYVVHKIRGQAIAILGARLDHDVGNVIFQRLLYLAPTYTESATVGSQVARVRDFDRLRDFLTGPLLTILFEIPFLSISLALIGVLGGTLFLVPLVMVFIFVVMFYFARPRIQYRITRSAQKSSVLQEFLLEAITNVKAIKYTASETRWAERYRELSADSGLAGLQMTMSTQVNTSVSNAIMIGSGMTILSFGALKIINGDMTVGAMVAIMILIWRVLGPLRTVYNTMPRLVQIFSSLRQIHRLMELQTESEPGEEMFINPHKFKGEVSFDRVSFRYSTAYDPALMGLTFKIPAGTAVGLVGRNGSGKSTVLKLVLGMYTPQAGSVRIDNQDIRQVNPLELRKSISYLPQTPELFYGTIAANLRLADPTATDDMLLVAADRAGILDEILALPEKFNTPIRDHSSAQLASGFQQGLCLARAYLKKSAIILLDEPGNVLDFKADQRLMESIDRLKGKATILMVTHRPSHLKKMDLILLFDQGQLLMQGAPEAILPMVPQELL